MRIGEIEIFLLSDGLVQVDAGGPFGLVPKLLYEPYFKPDESNQIPQCLTCMLVKAEGEFFLIDTGLGPKLTEKEMGRWGLQRPQGGLVADLSALGLEPADIHHVIDTHLHWDHCGGNTELDAGEVRARFPNATYWVQRIEWSEASHPDARTRGTYFSENFSPIVEQGRFRLLHGDTRINKHIQCVVTPGHTRGHQSVLLSAGDWRGLFVADMASYAINMAKTAWLPSYDVLPLENIRSKERWQRWALDQDAWLFFQHDPFTPVGRLVSQDGRLEVEAVAEAAELTAALPTPPPPGE
jgi:glyoxylase-like metal-dependent hydrolase (beta-lactamase superfamily II)